MDCAVCNQTGGTYRLVDGDRVGVCEQCVAEHLLDELDDETCMYCGGPADYDLVEYTGPLAGADKENDDHEELVAAGVVCGRHIDDLRSEGR